MTIDQVLKLISEKDVKFIDLRFTDTRGKEHHVSVPAHSVDEAFFTEGKNFDGSSIQGWKPIHASDMTLLPLAETAVMDPFTEHATLILRCDVFDPHTKKVYERDPRAIAQRAEDYLVKTGIADQCFVGPEPEFFIFDDVRWDISMRGASYSIDSSEASWNSAREYDTKNMGHRPGIKGGYFPVPPVDSSHDLRSTMCLALESMGLVVEAHHHEVATANQNEISTRLNTLVKKADEMQIFKYVIHNVAHAYGKTATFMPKPLVGDNGSGMHCHISLAKKGVNTFAGDAYAGLSEQALFFIGGVIKHAKALNAFCNSSTNSYKRLVPGFEAPVMLVYSRDNRSAAIRIPAATHPKKFRIEIRFPDACGNPYLVFAAILMAGLDGIQQKIHPGKSLDKDLYELSEKEARDIPVVCFSLDEAIQALKDDNEFLLKGDVFSKDMLEAYIQIKEEEIARLRRTTHPVEFDLYYSL